MFHVPFIGEFMLEIQKFKNLNSPPHTPHETSKSLKGEEAAIIMQCCVHFWKSIHLVYLAATNVPNVFQEIEIRASCCPLDVLYL